MVLHHYNHKDMYIKAKDMTTTRSQRSYPVVTYRHSWVPQGKRVRWNE